MDIEKAQELLAKFKDGIHFRGDKGIRDITDFQDVIGRSTPLEIQRFYEDLEDIGQKKHFIWCCFSCLAHDIALDILRYTIVYPSRDKYRAEGRQEMQLMLQEEKEKAKTAERQMELQVEDNQYTNDELIKAKVECRRLHEQVAGYMRDAKDMREIRRILVDIVREYTTGRDNHGRNSV